MAGDLTLDDYKAWVRRYYNHPVLMVQDVFGATPDEWQRDFLMAVARGDRNVGIKSGHRVGKTCALAWLCVWYMLTRTPFKIGITAPTTGQLYDALYAEIKFWTSKLPTGLQGLIEIMADRIDLKSSNGVSFLTVKTSRVETPEALAGLHSENTLLIIDEGSGVPDPVFEASSSSMAGENAQMVVAGNPLRNTGFFYRIFTDLKELWTTFTVNSTNSGRVSKAWIEEKKLEYGEESNQYRARVEGEFPRGDDDTIIPLEMVTSAIGREVLPIEGEEEIWGLDVADQGSNDSALCRRLPNRVPVPIERFNGLDTMQLVGRIHGMYMAMPPHKRPIEVNVDSNGIGAGVAARLLELGLPVNCVNVAETASIAGEKVYFNLRTELWFKARQWFAERNCCIPKDDRLVSDLTKIRLDERDGGRSDTLKAESKKAMKKRGIKSPDVGDAFCLTFMGTAATAAGIGYSRHRRKPIRRPYKGASYT